MLNYLMSFIIGALQGITEFFPISSSGHTLLLYHYLNIKNIDIIFLQVIVHFGTLCAIIIYFRKKLLEYLQAIYQYFLKRKKTAENMQNVRIVFLLILATIPLGVLGFLFEGYIENVVHQEAIVPFTLLIGGVLFLIIDKFASNKFSELKQLQINNTFLIGLAQVIALIPGVSRSGITILAGMGLGLTRSLAAEFTFLLAIPTLTGVTLKKAIDLSTHQFQSGELQFYVIALFTSFSVGFFAIKYLLKFLEHHSLKIFGWYRIVLAIIIFLIF